MASLNRWLQKLRHPWKAELFDSFTKFRKENGNARLYDYASLPGGSTVLDFGGFKGEWTERVLAAQPDCTVHVFEPHPGYAEMIREKFRGDQRVKVHQAALAREDGTLHLSDAGDASSAVADHDRSFEAETIAVERFFSEQSLTDVALAKMNIEGGEYSLLPALIDSEMIARIDRLQVQFHLFSPELKPERDAIRTQLERTHSCAWCYPFIWEEWRRSVS